MKDESEMFCITVFFPQTPRAWYTWYDAYEWSKVHNHFDAKFQYLTNPKHWDRENMLKENHPYLGETWFAWAYFI